MPTEGRSPLVTAVHNLRARIDDEPLASFIVSDIGVAPGMPALIAVLPLKGVKLVPDGFFVGKVDPPLDVYEHSVISAAFDGIADF